MNETEQSKFSKGRNTQDILVVRHKTYETLHLLLHLLCAS